MRDWCAGRLARFKRPKLVVFVDALPRTAAGKVRETEMRVPRNRASEY